MTPFGVAICLGIVNLLVVCGNVFVLYILISQKSLHTSTNFIVLSLTVSDFLLGVIVLPFSIFQEYSDSWMFGGVWCKTWLALDVLFSTASIYNLLAISFDRYMAVRQPIKYRFISSNRMTKITIAIVWAISCALAFPPLVYDHFGQIDPAIHGTNWTETLGLTPTAPGHGECTPMTSNNLYILFSAFVSFILPMFLMIGLNLAIFNTVNDSSKLTKSNGYNTANTASAYCSDDAWMRVHRGGAKSSVASKSASEIIHIGARSASVSAPNYKRISATMIQRDMIVYNGITRTRPSCPPTRKTTLTDHQCFSVDSLGSSTTADTGALLGSTDDYSTLSVVTAPTPIVSAATTPATWLQRMKKSNLKKQMIVEADRQSFHSVTSNPTVLYPYSPAAIIQRSVVDNVWYPAVLTSLLAAASSRSQRSTGSASSGGGKKSDRLLLYPIVQMNRSSLRTELRVARTIGVVVGCFTLCWLPFTVIYVLQAFETCAVGACIPPWMFTLAFWLGYANSAINPLLYAAFSRDFRSAFRKVLTDRNSSFRSF